MTMRVKSFMLLKIKTETRTKFRVFVLLGTRMCKVIRKMSPSKTNNRSNTQLLFRSIAKNLTKSKTIKKMKT